MSERGPHSIGSSFFFVMLIVVLLLVLAIVTAVAFSGALGTNFAITWIIALIGGGLIAYFLLISIKSKAILLPLSIIMIFVGLAMLISGLTPDIGLIFIVAGILD